MIRQAISCDICASEKRQTNHWFVAYEQGGELRVSGWNSRHRLRPDSKHLCGQTCLHKLVDEFMAKSISVRAQRSQESAEADPEPRPATDTSLTSGVVVDEPKPSRRRAARETAVASVGDEIPPRAFGDEVGSSARLIAPPEIPLPMLVSRFQPELVTMPSRPHLEDVASASDETQRYTSRNWRAEAWEREREREQRAIENRPDFAERRRRSNA